MAVGNNEIQVLWDTDQNSKSVAGAGNATSEIFGLSATAISRAITIKADNAGTPASGDTVDVYLLATCGDPDGSSADEYPAGDKHGQFIGVLDTNAVDGDKITTELSPAAIKDGKLYAKNNAASNAIVVSAVINEKTVS